MKIMIVPYEGGKQSQATTSEEGITRTQHAAREYHRNAKLRRAKAKGKPTGKDQSQSTAEIGRARSRKSKPGPPSTEEEWATESASSPEHHEQQQQQATSDSCLQTLLGVSRADPFKTGCVSGTPLFAHEMLDHAISDMWSEFRLSDDAAGLNAAKDEIMQSVMKSPQAWYTIIFAGATHDAWQHRFYGTPKKNSHLCLSYKLLAIGAVSQDIAQNGDNISEETLISMLTLASHGTGEALCGDEVPVARRELGLPFSPHSLGVEYYSAMEPGWEHLNAVCALVDKRGGLATIKMRSLRMGIQLFDIYTSWKRLRPPHFDLLAPTKNILSMQTHTSDAMALEMLETHNAGLFQNLVKLHTNMEYIAEVANNASIFSADFDQLTRCCNFSKEEQQRIGVPNMAIVKFTRWCVLHDILRIPPLSVDDGDVPESEPDPDDIVAEICRLLLLAYGVFAIVPMPSEDQIHSKLATKLERILHIALRVGIPASDPELFLCAVGWAFMCAHKAVQRPKLGRLLKTLMRFLECQELVRLEVWEWAKVEGVMKSFLWLENYCEEPGRKFWACACGIARRDVSD